MFSFSRRAAAALLFACSLSLAAGPALTTIQDVLYRADGTRYTGTVTITWTSFDTSDHTPVGAQAVNLQIVDGALKVRLTPTTTASAGANYTVKYNSSGQFQFSETWAVPPSSTPLRIKDVRVATGSVVGPPPVLTEVLITDVTGLDNELAVRPVKGAGFGPSRTAVIDTMGNLDAASGNPDDCVRVDGTSGPCGTASGSGGGPAIGYADGETPAGLVNGTNAVFTVNYPPSPASSLSLFRNGIYLARGVDYTVSGNTITFLTVATPQAGDVLSASYRYADPADPGTMMSPAQVVCSGTGQITSAATSTTLGYCSIPPGTIRPGDRVEIRYDFAHSGTATGFTVQAFWGNSVVLSGAGAAAQSFLSGRTDAAATADGAQWSTLSWGNGGPLSADAGSAPDGFESTLVVALNGRLATAAGDSIALRHFTVIRYPAQAN